MAYFSTLYECNGSEIGIFCYRSPFLFVFFTDNPISMLLLERELLAEEYENEMIY